MRRRWLSRLLPCVSRSLAGRSRDLQGAAVRGSTVRRRDRSYVVADIPLRAGRQASAEVARRLPDPAGSRAAAPQSPARARRRPLGRAERPQCAAYLLEDWLPAMATTVRPATLRMLAAACGLRRGEVCSLRWSDLDLDAGAGPPVLRVRQQLVVVDGQPVVTVPKTPATLRLVALDPRLGHTSTAFTLDIYSRAVPTMQADAALAVGALIFGRLARLKLTATFRQCRGSSVRSATLSTRPADRCRDGEQLGESVVRRARRGHGQGNVPEVRLSATRREQHQHAASLRSSPIPVRDSSRQEHERPGRASR